MIFQEVVDEKFPVLMDGKIGEMELRDIQGKYIVLVFYPLNFTTVCPTEVVQFNKLHDEFVRQSATVVFVSVDSVHSHAAWASASPENGGVGPVKWPMLSDLGRRLSPQFNLFSEKKGTCLRGTVILKCGSLEIQHLSVNVDSIGRSSREVLRLLKAMNSLEREGRLTCPVDYDE